MATVSSPIPSGTVFSAVLPWVNPGHQEGFLRETLETSGWGSILKVDWSLRKNANGREFFVVYVHFGTFPNAAWRKFLEGGGELKVYFNPRNFWKVRASRWKPRPAPVERVFVPHVEFPVHVHSVATHIPPPPLPPAVEAEIENEMEEVLDEIAQVEDNIDAVEEVNMIYEMNN